MLQIRKAEPADRPDWERLWRENCLHFGADSMSDAIIDALWQRILEDGHPMDAWLLADGEDVVGLAHTIIHPHTFTLRSVCYLEDLWVTSSARGRGVATALIDHLSQVGKSEGWRRIYWETGLDNEAARRLYERVAKRRAVAIYELDPGG